MPALLISIPIILGLISGAVYFLKGGTISLGSSRTIFAVFVVIAILGEAANILLSRELEGIDIPSDRDDDDLPPKDIVVVPPTPPGGISLSKAEKRQMFWDAVSKAVDNADKVKVEKQEVL